MCGIAGVWDRRGGRVDEAGLERMRDTMIHRGPDGAGSWLSPDGSVGLAHRRLSILDLSTAAAQPMGNEDGALQIVFNGEIYNHAELRRALETTGGHTWRTDHSDTEVILHAYETWGEACLDKFRGMFAFALWDGRKRALWLVRDRLGIKPLYYTECAGRLYFASEIKALLAWPEIPRRLDEEALLHYLSFLAAPAPLTLFAGIRKVPAACWLRFAADGHVVEQRYWDPLDHAQPRHDDEPTLRAELLELLRESVRLRGVSDVPVGVFLSGGVDSSTNAALFSAGRSEPIRTFSIGYRGDFASNPSELPYARRVADLVGAEHSEYEISQQDLLDFLPRMIALQDEPIADPVCVPVHFVAKLARDRGIKVCQVGEGADELFCGYPGWMQMLRLQARANWPLPRTAFSLGAALLGWKAGPDSMAAEWLRRAGQGRPLFWGGAECMTQTGKVALLGPRLRERARQLDAWAAIEPVHARFLARTADAHPLQWMTYIDLNYRLPELLHMRLDKMTMGVSLEAREPFMDHRLVEFALSLSARTKLGDGSLKHFLKASVRGLVPDDILDRPKQGFGVPVAEWLQDRLGAEIETTLKSFCRETALCEPAAVDRILRERRRGIVWTLMNLALWWKEYRLAG